MTRHIALIDGKAGAYGVAFPDLPGCTAMGKTMDEALANAAESLRDWTEVSEEEGKKTPAARSLEAVHRDRDVRSALAEGAIIATVPLIRRTGKPVNANLSIDAGVLDVIDNEAQRRSLSRSAMVELMTKEMLPRMG